jgi:pimeloyl-ACP methyl ester carboxylesterase
MQGMMRGLVLLVVLGLPATAAAEPPPPPPGVIILAGGVGGSELLSVSARWSLAWAGVPHEVRSFAWTHGKFRHLRDLQDTRHLIAKAEELAAEVRRLKAEDPARSVYLVGHSGGTGLILAAAERLPPGTVERMVLLSAAVSPGYDLRPALRATRGEIISFNSKIDLFWLSWGTSTFGTIDRCYVEAAGLNGFVEPEGLTEEDRKLYARLVQVGWHPEMVLGHYGGLHASTCMPDFLIHHVVPWLRVPVAATQE